MACFEEKLIAKVKQNSFLYNDRSLEYKNSAKREMTWIKISRELGAPTEVCKQRWKSLRDRFVRQKKKIEQSAASGDGEHQVWECYHEMEFLLPVLRPSRQKGNKPSVSQCKVEEAYSKSNIDSEDCSSVASPNETNYDMINSYNLDKSTMDALISEVRKRPCLYKKSAFDYRNKLEREKAWYEISEQLNVDGKICINKWRSLRDRYVKESHKEARDSPTMGSERQWQYKQSLDFLKSQITPRKPMIGTSSRETSKKIEKSSEEFPISSLLQDGNNDEEEFIISQGEEEHFMASSVDDDVSDSDNSIDSATQSSKRLKCEESALEENFIYLSDNTRSLKEDHKISSNHEAFFKMAEKKIDMLSEEEQEDAKMFFLNYLHEKIKKNKSEDL